MKRPKTTYRYGDELMLHNRQHLAYPEQVYVVSKEEGDYLIKLSEKFPYVPGDPHFFIHLSRIAKHYRHAKKGVQIGLFANCKKRKPSDDWREKYLKQAPARVAVS
jgi:hypothetical protein